MKELLDHICVGNLDDFAVQGVCFMEADGLELSSWELWAFLDLPSYQHLKTAFDPHLLLDTQLALNSTK